MFEAAELGRKVSKDDYEKQLPELRAGLLEAQVELQRVQGAGDPAVLGRRRSRQERDRAAPPRMARPPRARDQCLRPPLRRGARASRVLALLAHAARAGPHRDLPRAPGTPSPSCSGPTAGAAPPTSTRELGRIAFFEQMLVERRRAAAQVLAAPLEEGPAEAAADPRRRQARRRLEGLAPRVEALQALRQVHQGVGADRAPDRHAGRAPWFLVEAEDERYRELMVGRVLLEAMRRSARRRRLRGRRRGPPVQATRPRPACPCRRRRSRCSITSTSTSGSPTPTTRGSSSSSRGGCTRLARAGGREEGLERRRLRRLGRGGQGRQHPPPHRGHGPPPVPRDPHRRPHRRGDVRSTISGASGGTSHGRAG